MSGGRPHPIVALARETVETYVRTGKRPKPPADPDPVLEAKAGVFVSIKEHGELRGCIGTFLPTRKNIAEETIENAVAAATRDPRFEPINAEELPDLVISVDVLGAPEPVSDVKGLDPKRYGVIVSLGGRRGLLLPDLEGVDTVREQIRIAAMKAGIEPSEPGMKIERFEVIRYK